MPGVVAVLTAADLRGHARSLAPRLEGGGFTPTEWPLLAEGVVRFVGQAVAAVVAETRVAAVDGRERVAVDYEPRRAITTIDEALAASDVLVHRRNARGDVEAAFAAAAVVVRETFTHGRLLGVADGAARRRRRLGRRDPHGVGVEPDPARAPRRARDRARSAGERACA